MYVCNCSGMKPSHLKETKEGAMTPRELFQKFPMRPSCMRCKEEIKAALSKKAPK